MVDELGGSPYLKTSISDGGPISVRHRSPKLRALTAAYTSVQFRFVEKLDWGADMRGGQGASQGGASRSMRHGRTLLAVGASRVIRERPGREPRL